MHNSGFSDFNLSFALRAMTSAILRDISKHIVCKSFFKYVLNNFKVSWCIDGFFFDSRAYGLKNMKYFLPDGDPLLSTILNLSPVSFSLNSTGFASVAVDIINCGFEP